MRKGMVVGIALLLLVLRAHKLFISTKRSYRASVNRSRMLLGIERGKRYEHRKNRIEGLG